ncbi:chemotaxis protein CheA [Solimonas marina]|uniref:Chemotaxis protein CheA n=1 Tax=Solimonas marina TaxID=2714601 RepID=A0A970B5L6_9GAMM|nr:chemotaxis protein CheA [Solimonas marina]NKF21710.1 chemotaxis protein CheA [Solimonas marina]
MSTGDDDILNDFLAEAGELVEQLGTQLMALERDPGDTECLNAVFRAFHTVKGGAGFLQLTPLVELCHAAEDVLNAVRNQRRACDTDVMDAVLQAVDAAQTMMGELAMGSPLTAAAPELLMQLHALLEGGTASLPKAPPPPAAAPAAVAASDTISDDEFEALLDELQGKKPAAAAPQPSAPVAVAPKPAAAPAPALAPKAEVETIRVETQKLDLLMNLVGELVLVRNRLKVAKGDLDEAGARAIGELDFITRSLQNTVAQVRMQPIGKVFARFPKLARDIARQLGKQVNVQLEGEDTELDKNLVEALADPLVHMVRNSVDHGIEAPATRKQAGKPAAGTLLLRASQEGDHIRIDIRDDGAGIDPERLRAKALEKGLIEPETAERLSPAECLQLIFLPGFSTKEEVSDLSGRGVGMDVVSSRIKRLNGHVDLDSKPGEGTSLRIRVPLTLAVLPALIVRCDGRRFALPLAPVSDVFRLDERRVQRREHWDVVDSRGAPLRLVHLDRWLGTEPLIGARHVVVAQVGDERYGFVVREVVGREEIVIKPLGASLRGLAGVSGATVMPDGRIALILDFNGLVAAARALRFEDAAHG